MRAGHPPSTKLRVPRKLNKSPPRARSEVYDVNGLEAQHKASMSTEITIAPVATIGPNRPAKADLRCERAPKSRLVPVWMSADLDEALRGTAKRQHRTVASVVRHAIALYLEQQTPQ